MAQTVEQPHKPKTGHLTGEETGRPVFQMMRLVQNQPGTGRKQRGSRIVAALRADGQIGHQQRMVDHQQIRLRGQPPRPLQKAVAEKGTEHMEALIQFAANFLPNRLRRRKRH